MDAGQMEQVRRLWRDLTTAVDGFGQPGVLVVAAPDHRAAPPGWVGIVELLGSVVVAVPPAHLGHVEQRLGDTTSDALTDPVTALAVLGPVDDQLGPAVLAYGTTAATVPTGTLGPLPLDDARVQAVLVDATEAERLESGMDGTTSGVWLAHGADGTPGAVCGWSTWPRAVAHVCVLTARSHRGHGLAQAAATAALHGATAAGLLPQWRARADNLASLALARRLGLEPVGRQFSVRLAATVAGR